jgi:hypothetical protein
MKRSTRRPIKVTIAKPVQMKEATLQMSFRIIVVKAREEPKLLMYSFSPNNLLKEVFVMT